MAKRLNLRHSEEVRSKIQASQLVNALQNNVLGEGSLNSGQIKSAEILLRKIIPDLAAVNLNLDGEAAIKFVAELPAKSASPEAWLKEVKGDE